MRTCEEANGRTGVVFMAWGNDDQNHFADAQDTLRRDELTGLPLMKEFLEKAEERLAYGPAAFLYFNIENFRLVNRRYGIQFGNQMLLEIAQVLKKKYGKGLIENGTPIKAIFPGRCFRNEATDACHENTFFQMEGVMVDKDISISNLIYFMKTMLSEVFKKDIKVRLRPGFFPFVEPGFELDISCLICGGEGCPSCKHSGWLELCPCGMIHPNVLREGGIDPEKYTGFAFGLGLTRLAMMKYGIKDIRDLNSGSLKALSQFTDDE